VKKYDHILEYDVRGKTWPHEAFEVLVTVTRIWLPRL
jgi:hypothetical protein